MVPFKIENNFGEPMRMNWEIKFTPLKFKRFFFENVQFLQWLKSMRLNDSNSTNNNLILYTHFNSVWQYMLSVFVQFMAFIFSLNACKEQHIRIRTHTQNKYKRGLWLADWLNECCCCFCFCCSKTVWIRFFFVCFSWEKLFTHFSLHI